MSEIAKAYVTIGANLAPLKAGFASLKSSLGSAVSSLANIGMAAGAGLAAIGVASGVAGVALLKMGSNLEEQNSKFEAIFGGQSAKVKEWANSFGDAAGRSKVELEGMAADFAALVQPMGFNTAEATKLSTSMVQLATDLGSFHNLDTAEALAKIKSGLAGEAEPLKSLGILINDVTLSEKLRTMGLAKNAQAATEQQKVLARTAIIMESSVKAQGDAIKTAGSLSNQWRGLTGALYDLGSTIGGSLIPGANAVVGVFKNLAQWASKNKEVFLSWGAVIGSAVSRFVDFSLGRISGFVDAASAMWVTIGPVFIDTWNTVSEGVIAGVVAMMGFFDGLIISGLNLAKSVVEFGFRGQESFNTIGEAGSGAWDWIKETATAAFDAIMPYIKDAAFAVLNWDLTIKTCGVAIAEMASNGLGRIRNFVDNGVTLFQWFGKNWSDILFTAGDYVLTILSNLGKNIRSLWQGVLDFISGKGFKVDFSPLAEGAKSAIKEMPDFKEFIPTNEFDSQFEAITSEWQDRINEWETIASKNNIGKALGDGINAGLDKTVKAPEAKDMKGIIDFKKLDLKSFSGASGTKPVEPKDTTTKKESSDSKAGEKTSLQGAFDKLQEAALKPKVNSPEKQTAKNTGDMLAQLKEQTKALRDKVASAAKDLKPKFNPVVANGEKPKPIAGTLQRPKDYVAPVATDTDKKPSGLAAAFGRLSAKNTGKPVKSIGGTLQRPKDYVAPVVAEDAIKKPSSGIAAAFDRMNKPKNKGFANVASPINGVAPTSPKLVIPSPIMPSAPAPIMPSLPSVNGATATMEKAKGINGNTKFEDKRAEAKETAKEAKEMRKLLYQSLIIQKQQANKKGRSTV